MTSSTKITGDYHLTLNTCLLITLISGGILLAYFLILIFLTRFSSSKTYHALRKKLKITGNGKIIAFFHP
jgi:hypothetical protein